MKLFEPFITSIVVFCWIILFRKISSDLRIQKADLDAKLYFLEKFLDLHEKLMNIQIELIDRSKKISALRDLYFVESGTIIQERTFFLLQEIENKKLQNEADIREQIKVCKDFIVMLDECIANPDKYFKKKNAEILTVEKHGDC